MRTRIVKWGNSLGLRIPKSFADGYEDADRQLLLDMYRVSGKPIELNVLIPTPSNPMGWQQALAFCHEAFEAGVRLHPQFTTNKLELHLKLVDTFVFDEMPTWRQTLTRPDEERMRLATRYLGEEAGKRYASGAGGDSVTIEFGVDRLLAYASPG